MLLTGSSYADQVYVRNANKIKYHPLPDDEKWRVSVIKELTDGRRREAGDLNYKEIEETSWG